MNTLLKSLFSATLIILFLAGQAVGRGEGEFRSNERESPGRGGEGEFRGGERGSPRPWPRRRISRRRRTRKRGRGGEGFTNRSWNDRSPSFNPSRSNAYDRPYPSFNSGDGLA